MRWNLASMSLSFPHDPNIQPRLSTTTLDQQVLLQGLLVFPDPAVLGQGRALWGDGSTPVLTKSGEPGRGCRTPFCSELKPNPSLQENTEAHPTPRHISTSSPAVKVSIFLSLSLFLRQSGQVLPGNVSQPSPPVCGMWLRGERAQG